MKDAALDRVKTALGGNVGIASKLGDLTPQAVSQWRRVPQGRVRKISELTGIPAKELRPDLADFAEAFAA